MNPSFKNKLLGGLVILLLIANITTLIFFWLGMKQMHPVAAAQQPSQYLITKLALNNNQQQQYKELVKQHREQMKLIHDQLRVAKDSFFDLLAHEDTNDKNIFADRIAALNRQLDLQTFEHFKEVRKLCTADQQQKFDKVIKEVLRMMAGPGPQGKRPPGPSNDGPPPPHPGEGPDRPEPDGPPPPTQ